MPNYYLSNNIVNTWLRRVSGPAGSDDADMVVNASPGTPSIFEWTNGNSLPGNIEIVHFVLVDPSWSFEKFGALPPLTNGMKLEVYDTDTTTLLHDFFDGFPAKRLHDWVKLSKLIPHKDGNELHLDWTMSKLVGGQMCITPSQVVRCTIQDDLTGIQRLGVCLQGYHQ